MDPVVVQRPSSTSGRIRGAVIVLVYGRGQDLPACLDSLRVHSPPEVAVIVVDNGSPVPVAPPIAPAYPGVHFLRAARNRGYAGGNNVGAAYAFKLGAPLLYFLNDDTEVTDGFWQACEEAVQTRGASVVGSMLVRYDRPDTIELAGWHLDLRTLGETYRGVDEKYGPKFADYHPCDGVFGAALMVRADLFRAMGGFDLSYFHLWEEIDLCLRARGRGEVVACAGRSVVRHKGGASLGRQKPRWVFYLVRNKIWKWRRHAKPAVFWSYAPRRIARLLLTQLRSDSWLPRGVPHVLAAWAGTAAGFCWWRPRQLARFPSVPVPAKELTVAPE